jgi:hypothetical protein
VAGVKVEMSIERRIQEIFGGKAFSRPLFYTFPGGLRFELSEGGDWLEQFHSAYQKAFEICARIFGGEITVCVRIFGRRSLVSALSVIRDLREVGLYPLGQKEHWKEKNMESPDWTTDDDEYWHIIAFSLPVEALKKLLWCSLARDLRIKPCPRAQYYLFDLEKKIEVWPYDDRGMDVVGPNHTFLASLYNDFQSYLLEYDREAMNATFANEP